MTLDPTLATVVVGGPWPDLRTYEVPRLTSASVLSSFEVRRTSTGDRTSIEFTVRVDVDADAATLLLLIDTPYGAYCVAPREDGAAVVIIEAGWDVVPVRVLAMPASDVARIGPGWLAKERGTARVVSGGGAGFDIGGAHALDDMADADTAVDDLVEDDGGFVGGGGSSGRPPTRSEKATTATPSGPDRLPTTARIASDDGEDHAPPALPLAEVMAEMPGRTRVGDHATVTFHLSWERIAAAPDAAVDRSTIPIDPDQPIEVSISLRGYRLAASGSRLRRLRLASSDAHRSFRFRVEAVDEGPAEVMLVVRQGVELPLATLRLTSEIVLDHSSLPRVTDSAVADRPDPAVAPLPTIRVDESFADGISVLDVAVQIGRDRIHDTAVTIDKRREIADTYKKIAELRESLKAPGLRGRPEERRRVALAALRRRGVDLARRVFAPRIRQFLWEHRDQLDDLVIQTTGEFDIPWELIYISDPARSVDEEPDVVLDRFLGMRGATRWVYGTPMPTHVEIRRGHARYLCPAYRTPGMALAFTKAEGKMISKAFAAKLIRPGNAASMSAVIRSDFDLLHFGGHGTWTAAPPDQKILFERYATDEEPPDGSSYSAAQLRRDLPDRPLGDHDRPVQMVFLNACDVGRFDTSEPGLGGFPEAFLRGGVGVMLGCSWAVDDKVAGRFVEHFYAALRQADISDAVRVARAEAVAEDDLTALAYVAYAHPRATVTLV